MNIIFLDWPCFCRESTLNALKTLGHAVSFFIHPEYTSRKSSDFDRAFDQYINNNPHDLFFSYNYYPLVSEGCKRHNIPYISIVYDSPFVALYSYTIVYPCNHVFLFDRAQYEELHNMGITTVHYMPLAGDTAHIKHLLALPHEKERYQADISFVGSLYNEDHNLFDRLSGLSEYAKGYLSSIMESQLKVYGYYFIEKLLTKEILSEMKASIPYEAGYTGIETDEFIYGDYFIGRKLTEMDRIRTLTSVAKEHPLHLYTLNRNFQLPGVKNMGAVDYDREMPYVFYYSKINLNITLKSIKSGIPLRAIDIMSAGGFLLTNYQPDFLEHFIPDEDFVYYTDLKELNEKIAYYLIHEKERKKIAENGQRKIHELHSFVQHFLQIFNSIPELSAIK